MTVCLKVFLLICLVILLVKINSKNVLKYSSKESALCRKLKNPSYVNKIVGISPVLSGIFKLFTENAIYY
jgi:hypothetical protein